MALSGWVFNSLPNGAECWIFFLSWEQNEVPTESEKISPPKVEEGVFVYAGGMNEASLH